MKSYNLLILLTVIFVSPYAFAQIPSCPCDTGELPNGYSGDEIVAILCPGGNLAAGNESFVDDQVSIVRPPYGQLELGYAVYIEGDLRVCEIYEDTIGSELFKVTDEEYQNCRERLLRGCSLNVNHNIPTLSEWGMIATASGLGIVGLFFVLRRKRAAAEV